MDAQKIAGLLDELEAQLRSRGESNWIRGVMAAKQALKTSGGPEEARSIYATMNQGVDGFADYNVWHEDFDTRRALNAEIDRLRTELWNEFEL